MRMQHNNYSFCFVFKWTAQNKNKQERTIHKITNDKKELLCVQIAQTSTETSILKKKSNSEFESRFPD